MAHDLYTTAEVRSAFDALGCGYPAGVEEGLDLEDEVSSVAVVVEPTSTPASSKPQADVSATPVAVLYYSPETLYVTSRPPYAFRREPVGKVITGTWANLCRWLSKSGVTDLDLDADVSKRACGAWVGGAWTSPVRGTARAQGFVSTRLVIVDVDGGDPVRVARALGNYATCIHSTAKHTPTSPRCRVVVLCSRPITSAREYGIVHGEVRRQLASRGFVVDDGAHDVGRLNYLPMHRPDVTPGHIVTSGKPLDVDRVLIGAANPSPNRRNQPRSPTRGTAYVERALANETERVSDAVKSDRHNQNFRSGASLARAELGLDDDAILDALLPAAERADPDEDPAELERTIRDGITAGARRERVMRAPGTGGNGFSPDEEDAPIDIEGETEKASAPPWADRFHPVPPEWYTTPPPPRQWLLRDLRNDREGVFPLGVVGGFAAEGGAGKTTMVTQLAVAVASGGTWLGVFDVPKPGKALLVLGEEDDAEGHRKIFRSAREAGVAPGGIEIAPLSGIPFPLVDRDGKDTSQLDWLRRYVERTGPYTVVVLDPSARFAPPEAERDNSVATRYLTALETLIPASGGASVLVACHTNQESRKPGTLPNVTMFRGVTGFTDGGRWAAGAVVDRAPGADPAITFAVVKSNYAKYPAPVNLKYGDGGIIVPANDDDRTKAQAALAAADPSTRKATRRAAVAADTRAKEDQVVLGIVREQPGIITRDLLRLVKARVHVADGKATTIIARVIDQGDIRREPDGKSSRHYGVEPKAASPHANANGAHAVDVSTDPFAFINPKGSA